MGNMFSDPKSKIMIVGLDNAGKSTLINKMQPEEVSLTHSQIIILFSHKIIDARG